MFVTIQLIIHDWRLYT